MAGRPSAAHEPPWRYFATISCSENGSSASGSTHGPSSRTVTERPARESVAAVTAPPAPEPMINTSVSIVSTGGFMSSTGRRCGRVRDELVLGEQHQRLQQAHVL